MASCAASKSNGLAAASAPASMVSVRAGISRGSCGSDDMLDSNFPGAVHLMSLGRQLMLAVGLEALAAEAPSLRVAVDDFGYAREALQSRGQPVAQIDQHIGRRGGIEGGGQVHWRLLRVHGFLVTAQPVRYERLVVEGPQQVIERLRIGSACAQDHHAQTPQIRFLDQPASESEALLRR